MDFPAGPSRAEILVAFRTEDQSHPKRLPGIAFWIRSHTAADSTTPRRADSRTKKFHKSSIRLPRFRGTLPTCRAPPARNTFHAPPPTLPPSRSRPPAPPRPPRASFRTNSSSPKSHRSGGNEKLTQAPRRTRTKRRGEGPRSPRRPKSQARICCTNVAFALPGVVVDSFPVRNHPRAIPP